MFEDVGDVGDVGDAGDVGGLGGAAVLARQLAAGRPGPAAASLAALYDPATCEPAVTVDLLVTWERVAAWVAGQQQRCLAALPVPPPAEADEDWVREEVAAALHLSAGTAQDRLDVARALARRLPATMTALQEGQIRYWQAAAVVESVEPLSDEAAARVERQVLARASTQTMGETRRSLRRAVLAADPVSAALRHQRALRQRGVSSWPMEDGMGQLTATLSAEGLATVMTALDAVADRRLARMCSRTQPDGGAARLAAVVPADARRADALVEIALAALAEPDLPRRHGSRPQTVVMAPASTLLGLDETPAELRGYGAISAAQARRIATRGERHQWAAWPAAEGTRLSRPPHDAAAAGAAGNPGTGPADDRSATGGAARGGPAVGRYRPPVALRRFLLARDAICRFPGCAVPAYRCDLDHTRPFADGGPTSADNLAPLCRRHHRAKTHGGWTLTIDRTGTATWTSPTSHTYRTEREDPGRAGLPAPDE